VRASGRLGRVGASAKWLGRSQPGRARRVTAGYGGRFGARRAGEDIRPAHETSRPVGPPIREILRPIEIAHFAQRVCGTRLYACRGAALEYTAAADRPCQAGAPLRWISRPSLRGTWNPADRSAHSNQASWECADRVTPFSAFELGALSMPASDNSVGSAALWPHYGGSAPGVPRPGRGRRSCRGRRASSGYSRSRKPLLDAGWSASQIRTREYNLLPLPGRGMQPGGGSPCPRNRSFRS
jgi:hypothetical protein